MERMKWSSIREFLKIPEELTGKNVNIAVIDASFAAHPDIASNGRRCTYLVKTSDPNAEPRPVEIKEGPWNKGSHGLWCAASAAGSGHLSSGLYTGAAPDANLYLLETGPFRTACDIEEKFSVALEWLKANWRACRIRGVVLTVTASRDTGLLPWQADPVRILCEELAEEGLLVVSSSGNTTDLTCNGPSASPSVLSVGGVIVPMDGDSRHATAYHGCRGMTFEKKGVPEILAPAENIVIPYPFQSEQERLNHYTAPFDGLPEGYARTEGTSYAGPILLGAAACIWEAHPSWTANQVKSAMLSSSFVTEQVWEELRSGLVDVSAAVNMLPEQPQASPESPYSRWQSWRSKDIAERITSMTGPDEEDVLAALLSLFPEKPSLDVANHIRPLLKHASYPIRAASIILLSGIPEYVTKDMLQPLFKDNSSYVRMGALYALSQFPDIWKGCAAELTELMVDREFPDISCCAITLAGRTRDSVYVRPLIEGLREDALHQRVSNFSERCMALEQITGMQFEPHPEWRDGQCFYSERTTESRLDLARQWISWGQGRGILCHTD
ncbi:S8 family serine peptidase [Paenibacillus spongiae]|uniref:S8 family serine peptidase n=1 Tax=Paenibacillus spongiae TaxID=2909671 RepID=A0ABY5S7J8_9BACL|nr:S8 family serine peptidase [Paenibacillus spongiae]UVI29483.1 S8 family serine peptidase [Paenibacillus spongiae]